MKKLFSIALAAFALMVVGCNKEETQDPSSQPGTSVVGTWYYHAEDFGETYELNEDNSYTLLEMFYKEEGSYAYGSGSFALTPTKAWTRDWVRDERSGGPILDADGNYQYTDWVETEAPAAVSYPAKLIYEGDVLMLKMPDDYSDDEVWAPYVKTTATHVSNINDIQGKWYWLSVFGDYTMRRVIVNVSGSTGDVIITPWGERYTGTIRYEKGIIYMDNPTFTTTRYEDEDGEWEHMNDADPENSPWRAPSGEYPYEGAYEGGLAFAFVADGNVAYGGMANLMATFEKQ